MKNFEELGISSGFVKGLTELDIINPTEIQELVIPILLGATTDMVGQAQTGTGKTAAYGLPLLQQTKSNMKGVQGLILVPTRELARQVAKQLFKFTKYSSKIFTEAVYGGEPIDRQISSLRRPTQIIVATPGRLIDLVDRKAVDLSTIRTVVLDEADEMLSMGFKEELNKILSGLPAVRSKWLFSATMPKGIQEIIARHLSKNAKRIVVGGGKVVNQNIMHLFQRCDDLDKLDALVAFLESEEDNRGVIFCRTKEATKELTQSLRSKKVSADALHGDLYQKERDKVMRAFKKKNLRLLVATDVAARGIDVSDLSFVAHYQLPESTEYYTHRSGRTARAGKKGISICFANDKEAKTLKDYERALGIKFKQVNKNR